MVGPCEHAVPAPEVTRLHRHQDGPGPAPAPSAGSEILLTLIPVTERMPSLERDLTEI